MKNEENDKFFDDLAALNDKEPEKPEISILDAIKTADELVVKETEWIIEHAIPRGAITIIPGREECGKSTLTSQICVDVATGRMSLLDDYDNYKSRPPMRTLYIDAEESEAIIAKRFKQMGANKNVAILDKRNKLVAELTTTSPLMRQLVEGYRPDLMVLSPISSFLPPRCNATKKKDVVQALRPLIDLADEFSCAIVIVQHTNKQESPDYRKCIADSSYFSEAPRNIIMMGKTENVGEVFVSVEKGSLSNVYEPYKTRILRFKRDVQALELVGTTEKKWRDFVLAAQGRDVAETNKAATDAAKTTKLGETKRIILDTLREFGQMERDWCIRATQEAGASAGSWEKAIRQLKDEGAIDVDVVWNGHVKTATYKIAGSQDDTSDPAKEPQTEEPDDDDIVAIF